MIIVFCNWIIGFTQTNLDYFIPEKTVSLNSSFLTSLPDFCIEESTFLLKTNACLLSSKFRGSVKTGSLLKGTAE